MGKRYLPFFSQHKTAVDDLTPPSPEGPKSLGCRATAHKYNLIENDMSW